MSKPEHFIYLEETYGSCYFRESVSKLCHTCGKGESVGEKCGLHKFELPRFDVFKCKCKDYVREE